MAPFRFGVEKKIQAAAVILRAHGPMDYLRLLKLLYIADRQSLAERGAPIIGGLAVAMKHGPLHSEVYDWIKGQTCGAEKWSRFVETREYTASLRNDPGDLNLSEFEIDKLLAVAGQFQDYDTWELAQYTHGFEEWQRSFVENTSRPIPPDVMMKAVGMSDEDIQAAVEDANLAAEVQRRFGVVS